MDDGTHEFLTVKELADLLRLKERKVYDLAASGAVPCSRATGKLLFPERDIRAWIAGSSEGGMSDTVLRPGVFLGSHDPLLEWALRQSRCGLATFFDGSMDGLTRLRSGQGIAAGLHVQDPESGAWNIPVVKQLFAGQNVVLTGFAKRQRGLVLRNDELDCIKGLGDLRGRRLAARQPESGTARVLSVELARAGVAESDIDMSHVARSETDAVLAVVQGISEVTFGLEPLAQQFGLKFIPVVTERFDLLVDRKAWFDPPMQTFLDFCGTEDFKIRARSETGYDITELGKVRWNGDTYRASP
ncbi:MAG: helix-turn-helix transcriptional regulator [Pseudomonadota bacterium]